MDNRLRSKTRLVAIQLVSQHLVNKQDINLIKEDFDKYYRNTVIDESLDKVQYNINFLTKLINYYNLLDTDVISKKINDIIKFDRKFENWDTINKAIVLISLGELENSNKEKIKIILNDYIEISKSFISIKETKLINLILDKLIYEKI
tara:strand:- start:109 stop:552 length:444 start_codon:yes stop_codon:yes gene_type:complete